MGKHYQRECAPSPFFPFLENDFRSKGGSGLLSLLEPIEHFAELLEGLL